MKGGEEEVEGYAPVAEDGEIREAESCGCASVGQLSYFPKDSEEQDEKCIEGN